MGEVHKKSYSSKNCLEEGENISWAICWRILQMRMKAATFIFCFYYYPVLSPVVYQNECLSEGLRYPGVAEGKSRANLKVWFCCEQAYPACSHLLCSGRDSDRGAVALSSAQTGKGDEDSVPSPRLLIPAQNLDDCLPYLYGWTRKHTWECCSVLLPSHVILGQVCLERAWSDNNDNALLSVIKATMI